jgi:hypothetical protein
MPRPGGRPGRGPRNRAIAASAPDVTGNLGEPHAHDNFGRSGTESQYVRSAASMEVSMNGLIYLVGLVVVVMAILSFFGLR